MPLRRIRLGALGERDFALFFCGYSLSLTGSAMVPVALSFAIFARGGGTHGVSLVLAAEMTPMVILLLLGGVIADRLPRRRVMVGADLLRCSSQALMAALLLLPAHASLLPIMALASLLGIGNAFYIPSHNGLVPQIASPAHLQSANALIAIAQSGGALLGPVLAGLRVAGAGAGWAIAIDSGSYAAGAVLLLAMRLPAAPKPARTTHLLHELHEGWGEFIRRPWVWLVVLQFSLFFLLAYGPLQVLGPLGYARMPHGALRWGGLLSMFGLGSVAGGMLALRLRPARPILAALPLFALVALPPACLAAHASYPLRAAGFLAGGFGLASFNVLWETTLQRAIPEQKRSRVSAFDAFGSICLLPLGYVLAAPMASLFGRDGTLWIGSAYVLVSTLAVLGSRSVRGVVA